jgi:hypothetical protein
MLTPCRKGIGSLTDRDALGNWGLELTFNGFDSEAELGWLRPGRGETALRANILVRCFRADLSGK